MTTPPTNTDECPAKLEPDQPPARTHTCDLDADHEGPHQCPVCLTPWGPGVSQ